MTKDVLDLLDPSLDIWNNATEGYADRQEFGDTGWALAVVTALEPTEMGMDELCRITRVGERQARRIVDRLEASGWARRVRQGRRVRVVVDFSLMNHEDLRGDWLKTARRTRKAFLHQQEGRVLKHLGSSIGRAAKDMWENRKRDLRMLMDWAEETRSRCWDELIKILRREPLVDKKTKVRNPGGIHYWTAMSQICEYFRSTLPKTG